MKMINTNLPKKKYQNIFLVQNRDYWHLCPFPFDTDKDLVLTFDFGVWKEITQKNGMVYFLDHLLDKDTMELYNYKTYDFFSKWYFDNNNKDIFSYKGVEVGNAFRIDIWNDITYYVRIWINLLTVKKIKFQKILIGIEDRIIHDILKRLNIKVQQWNEKGEKDFQEYFFPVSHWMQEQIHPSSGKQLLKSSITSIVDIIFKIGESLKIFFNKKKNIFVQNYHPTKKIINRLKQEGKVNVILEDYTWTSRIWREKRLLIRSFLCKYISIAKEMLRNFNKKRCGVWQIEKANISNGLYEMIKKRISNHLPYYLRVADSIINFFSRTRLDLIVSISNIGIKNSLIQSYGKKNNIPRYLIINGLLSSSFLDEAKDGTWINSYGESIKKNYFQGMKNVVCFGDPRMDEYINIKKKKLKNTDKPTILIGAAGFSNVDLNSYVAFEFDFLNDIIRACQTLMADGRKMDLIIKVRANGYISQYTDFIKEYFPDIPIEIHDRIPIKQLYGRADFYISIFSQTLFEASCLGIPVLYYKKDTQILHPPFDGESELVTAMSFNDLVKKIELFYKQDSIYDIFKDKKVMEKYIGPLDGNNLKRNMDFIYSLVSGI